MYAGDRDQAPGVYAVDEQGGLTLLHEYQNEDYSLDDVQESFGLGAVERGDDAHGALLVLDAKEIRELRVNADAYSFDYDEGFIQMCLDIDRYYSGLDGEKLRLISVE
ncbi:MAG: hypothetical protein R3286_19525 [Gammaproteobacteria bacterium]|nr:hypothetical protein [Gammaproteobacteria bacterium]